MLNFRRQALQRRIQADPYYRFQSLDELAIAKELGIRIEVNQATVDEWLRLPGLSIHQARQLTELTGMGIQFLAVEDVAAALNLSVQQLAPFAPILSFTYSDPDSLLTPLKIPVNQATLEELLSVPALNPAIAKALLAERETGGNYQSLGNLQKRLKLSVGLVSELLHYLQF
jgi:DNA uptake protein ComE-like DNA-binding protein